MDVCELVLVYVGGWVGGCGYVDAGVVVVVVVGVVWVRGSVCGRVGVGMGMGVVVWVWLCGCGSKCTNKNNVGYSMQILH